MIVNSACYPHSPLHLLTWSGAPEDVPSFAYRTRPLDTVDEIMVHESAVGSTAATIRALRRRDLGVHFVVAPSGHVTQHGDVADRMAHAARHNAGSVAIEVVNPYEPKKRPSGGGPWQDVIDAPWAHGDRYVLPTIEQCEALSRLICLLLGNDQLSIPPVWHGLRDGKWLLRRLPVRSGQSQAEPAPGIWAHHHAGAHSDGAWPLLVAWMVLALDYSVADAYGEAKARAEGARRYVSVADLV